MGIYHEVEFKHNLCDIKDYDAFNVEKESLISLEEFNNRKKEIGPIRPAVMRYVNKKIKNALNNLEVDVFVEIHLDENKYNNINDHYYQTILEEYESLLKLLINSGYYIYLKYFNPLSYLSTKYVEKINSKKIIERGNRQVMYTEEKEKIASNKKRSHIKEKIDYNEKEVIEEYMPAHYSIFFTSETNLELLEYYTKKQEIMNIRLNSQLQNLTEFRNPIVSEHVDTDDYLPPLVDPKESINICQGSF